MNDHMRSLQNCKWWTLLERMLNKLKIKTEFCKYYLKNIPSEELIRRGVKRGDSPDDDRLRSHSDMSPELLLQCNSVVANLLPRYKLLQILNNQLREQKGWNNNHLFLVNQNENQATTIMCIEQVRDIFLLLLNDKFNQK